MNEAEFLIDEVDEDDDEALVVCNEEESMTYEEWQEMKDEASEPSIVDLMGMIYSWGVQIKGFSTEDLDSDAIASLAEILKEFKDSLEFTSKEIEEFLKRTERRSEHE